MLDFSKARSALEYRLLLMHTPVASPDMSKLHIYEACKIAAVIYINYVLHEFDPVFRILEKLKEKLTGVIEAGEISPRSLLGTSESSLLIWVFFVGGLLADGKYEREWFATRISVLMRLLELIGWDQVEKLLMKVLWIKRMHNSACDTLWRQINKCLNGRSSISESLD